MKPLARPRTISSWTLLMVAALAGPSACSEPNAPTAEPSARGTGSVSAAAPAPVASATASPSSSAAPAASATAAPSAAPVAPPLDLAKAPVLLGEDGKPLPQTKDEPSVESPAFKKRMDDVWAAMVANDAALAEQSFFPKVAYEQVKDIENAGADWKSRLMRAFSRNVGEYHKKLGAEPQALTFLGVEIDPKRVKWIEPGKEGNKIGYWRVTRSKLRYRDPAGTERTLELTSLISWRGEWFVVHLNGFK